MSDVDDATAVNAALYEAFETADVDRMERVWDDVAPDALVCVHPGWPMLRGREQVLRSWAAVMAGTETMRSRDCAPTTTRNKQWTCMHSIITAVSPRPCPPRQPN